MKKGLRFLMVATLCLALAAPLFASGEKEAAKPAAEAPAVQLPTAENPIRLGIVIPGALGDSPPVRCPCRRGAEVRAARQADQAGERVRDGVRPVQVDGDSSSPSPHPASTTWSTPPTRRWAPWPWRPRSRCPNVKFIVNDCYVTGNDRIFTSFFNKYQQGYLYGYTMALVSSSSMKGMNADKKIGLVYGQHYVHPRRPDPAGHRGGRQGRGSRLRAEVGHAGQLVRREEGRVAGEQPDRRRCRRHGLHRRQRQHRASSARRSTAGSTSCYFDVAAFDKAPGTIVGKRGRRERATSWRRTSTSSWRGQDALGQARGARRGSRDTSSMPLRAPGYVRTGPRRRAQEIRGRVRRRRERGEGATRPAGGAGQDQRGFLEQRKLSGSALR